MSVNRAIFVNLVLRRVTFVKYIEHPRIFCVKVRILQ